MQRDSVLGLGLDMCRLFARAAGVLVAVVMYQWVMLDGDSLV